MTAARFGMVIYGVYYTGRMDVPQGGPADPYAYRAYATYQVRGAPHEHWVMLNLLLYHASAWCKP